MANSFENSGSRYFVLINEEGQHSLWPENIPVPEGWTVAHGPDGREECLESITANWVDMRPRSLVLQMEAAAESGANHWRNTDVEFVIAAQ